MLLTEAFLFSLVAVHNIKTELTLASSPGHGPVMAIFELLDYIVNEVRILRSYPKECLLSCFETMNVLLSDADDLISSFTFRLCFSPHPDYPMVYSPVIFRIL